MKTDIAKKEDVILMVDTFYQKVKKDEAIGYIFNEIAGVNWEHHLPKMYSFWASLLLGEQSYHGNPMSVHIDLSRKVSLGENEFSAWIRLFRETIDELFEGEKATEARQRAEDIARLMLFKIKST